jgi:hypothetical protein
MIMDWTLMSRFFAILGVAGADMFFNICGFDVSSVERTQTPTSTESAPARQGGLVPRTLRISANMLKQMKK